MPDYQELKNELENIASLIEKYPEDLKLKVFDLLINEFFEGEVPAQKNTSPNYTEKTESQNSEPVATPIAQNPTSQNQNPNSGGSITFAQFAATCNEPSSASEKNLLIIYYFEIVSKEGPVQDDQIEDLYKKTGWKPNRAFRQGLNDTKTKKGWIYFEDDNGEGKNGWLTTHQGVNYVKDELLKG